MGAWVWASGSQVWNGNIGTLMPKPMNMPPKISTCVDKARSPAALRSATPRARSAIAKLSPPVTKNRARKLTIMSAEPNSVNRKNLIAAYCRSSPPHTPIMKYIGSRTSSKKTKNRIRSWATNEPSMPVWSTSVRIRNAFGLRGSGKWSQL